MSTPNTLRQLVIAKKAAIQLQTELFHAKYQHEVLPHICKGVNIKNYTFASAIEAIIKELENEILLQVEDME